MKYQITTSSSWGDEDESPWKTAKKEPFPRYDTRTCTEEYYNEHLTRHDGKKWREVGTDHTVLPDGNIRRTMEDENVWVVEINTLEELMKLQEECGHSIIISSRNPIPSIEIYDGYRE